MLEQKYVSLKRKYQSLDDDVVKSIEPKLKIIGIVYAVIFITGFLLQLIVGNGEWRWWYVAILLINSAMAAHYITIEYIFRKLSKKLN